MPRLSAGDIIIGAALSESLQPPENVNSDGSSEILCFSCDEPIKGRPLTTETGKPICRACDRFYAYGGEGEND